MNLSAKSFIATVPLQQKEGCAQINKLNYLSATASILLRCLVDPSRSNSFTEFSVSDALPGTSQLPAKCFRKKTWFRSVADCIRYFSQAQSSPRCSFRAALKLQGHLGPLLGCSGSLQLLHPPLSPSGRQVSQATVLSGKNESSCCPVVADKGGNVFVQDKEGPLGSVRWEEAG